MTQRIRLPLLPLRGLAIFPRMVLHFDVARNKSVAALEEAMASGQRVFLLAQREEATDVPTINDLYDTGTIAYVKQVLKLPGETNRVLVEGVERARLLNITRYSPHMEAEIEIIYVDESEPSSLEAYVRTAHDLFVQYAEVCGRVPKEVTDAVLGTTDPFTLPDLIATHSFFRLEYKQTVLACVDPEERLSLVCEILVREMDIQQLEKSIHQRVRAHMEKHQREFYLREQIRVIQKELGESETNEINTMRERAEKLTLNDEVRNKLLKEIDRLSHMPSGSPEVTVSRTYIEFILDLPWNKESVDKLDLKYARKVLDEDHYGLDKVKQRIIEYLAVRRLKNDMKGPILCFVGPPGVGKTSIARSVARAMGRKFAHMSLGGVRDEAEIRGHRRTYIGAIPGRVLASIKQVAASNPVFLFDEIDKLSSDLRGDPSAAMLEVLDSEQNHAFRDHYLEVPFDLSKVLFLMTANREDTIPAPLRDRMEIIRLSGYTEDEKYHIAKKYLVKKHVEGHGLPKGCLRINEKIIRQVIRDYTREAGVRELSRKIEDLCRKAACRVLDEGVTSVTVTPELLRSWLGAPRYRYESAGKQPLVGTVTGLAWTPVGGDTLSVEVTPLMGKGEIQLTGQLGDVMKESARAALTVVRSRAPRLGVDPAFYGTVDLHVHVPEGAIPKDGPSAGITLCTALMSALSGRAVRQDLAMTGEITLRGRVLPVGGVKEKLLAAHRAGVTTILLPEENQKDLEEVPQNVLNAMTVIPVSTIDDVFDRALMEQNDSRQQLKPMQTDTVIDPCGSVNANIDGIGTVIPAANPQYANKETE